MNTVAASGHTPPPMTLRPSPASRSLERALDRDTPLAATLSHPFRRCVCCAHHLPATVLWFTRRNGRLDRTCRGCHRARQTRLRCQRGLAVCIQRIERLMATLAEAEKRVGKRRFPW